MNISDFLQIILCAFIFFNGYFCGKSSSKCNLPHMTGRDGPFSCNIVFNKETKYVDLIWEGGDCVVSMTVGQAKSMAHGLLEQSDKILEGDY